jgi:hypothetical protein
MRLSNRASSNSFFWEDNDFNKKRKQKPSDELIVDEISLYKSVIETMKENNCHTVDPYLLKEAIDSLAEATCYSGGLFCSEFFIEKQELNNNKFYIITFNAGRDSSWRF